MDLIKNEYDVILERKEEKAEGSYSAYLFEQGLDKILKKVGEECTETVIAAKNNNNTETVYEITDLLYHVLVMMAHQGITPEDIEAELAKRAKKLPDHGVQKDILCVQQSGVEEIILELSIIKVVLMYLA